MKLRRVAAVLAVPVLAAGLAACGPGEPDAEEAPTVQEETPTDEDTATEERTEEPSEEATSAAPTKEESDPEVSPTSIETMWIDDSWTIDEVAEDLCGTIGGHATQYSEQEDLFVCGPTAAGAEACALEDGTVQCIVDPVGRLAIEFESSIAPEEAMPHEGEAIPLLVTLPDDVTCSVISHDHDQHWNQMFSWYRCDDGSELLTPEAIADTFERGDTWTVQRSRDQGEPEETAVLTAVFAGR